MQAAMLSERTDIVSQVSGTTQRGRGFRREMAHLLIRIMKHSKDINFQLYQYSMVTEVNNTILDI